MVTAQTVVYVDHFEPAERHMVDITLKSGKTVSVTDHHMMVIMKLTAFTLCKASNIQVGDLFYSQCDVEDSLAED